MKFMFDHKKTIGEGAFGTVYKGKLWYSSSMILKGYGSREVAVKRVELRHVDKRKEEAMLKLNHTNIVRLFQCEKDRDFMYYVLELCDASLYQLFLKSDDPKKYNGRMPREIEVFHQLATGLAYIHSKKLIHRDIKPSNILIMRKPGKYDEIIMKWSDFGLTKSINKKRYHLWPGVRETSNWYAPEVLQKLIEGERAENEEFWGTGVKSDVFCLGLVFGYIFLKGEHLFGSREKDIYHNIMGKHPVNMKNIDVELRKYYEDDLLTKMLEYDQKKRMNSAEVVEQLESIKNKLTEKEKEFFLLCAGDSSPDLVGKINDFIRLGVDVKAKDDDGMNALHHLCKSNSSPDLIDAIQLLIPLGIDVNAKDNSGRNALHYLCRSNSSPNLIDAIQLLIQLGMDVNAKEERGQNALHLLCESNSSPNLIDAIQLLIQLGNRVISKDHNARTFLLRNRRIKNKDEILKLLDEPLS